jgi:hypothetical protein
MWIASSLAQSSQPPETYLVRGFSLFAGESTDWSDATLNVIDCVRSHRGGLMDEQASSASAPGAGWYPDPNDSTTQRYWDGTQWTESRAPRVGEGRQTKTNGMSIAALVLGILWIWWIGSVLALIFGYIGKNQIDQSGGQQTGRGMAIAGIVLGWIGVGTLILVIILSAAGSIDTT